MALSERDGHFYTRRRCRESGQGVTEYILVLVVSIALILGVTFQLNDAFKVWANNYFGDYLSCLLEAGELPAIGGSGGVAGVCDRLFQPFSLANGRPFQGPGIGGGGGGGSGSASSSNGNPDNSPSAARGVSESSETSGYTRVNKRGGGSEGVPNSLAKLNGQDSEDGGGRRRNVYTGNTEMGVPGNVSSIGAQSKAGVKDDELVGGFYVGRSDARENRTTQFAAKLSEKSNATRKARFLVERKPAKAGDIPADEPMTFGDYLRYILIAALILALVLVVGGQLLQISNEME